MEEWKHEFIHANGIRIHYVTAGKGPLLLLLHGFPEFWYAWRHQIGELAEHYHVVAPDLRGYGNTDRPPRTEDYQSNQLVGDVVGLIQALNYEKAHIVGHDWGGAIAWRTALEHPEVVDHLAILNSPHPSKFVQALRSNFKQMRRSWYIFFFQLPYLPELIFKMSPKRFLDLVFKDIPLRQDTISHQDLEIYRQALEKPGAFTAALNYYRAAFRKKGSHPVEKKNYTISAPTLIIWGEKDTALGKELTENMDPLFSGPFHIEYIPNCSHWVNEEKADVVNQLLLKFLK